MTKNDEQPSFTDAACGNHTPTNNPSIIASRSTPNGGIEMQYKSINGKWLWSGKENEVS